MRGRRRPVAQVCGEVRGGLQSVLVDDPPNVVWQRQQGLPAILGLGIWLVPLASERSLWNRRTSLASERSLHPSEIERSLVAERWRWLLASEAFAHVGTVVTIKLGY